MDFIVPYDQLGITPPGPWQNASPQAGTRGSIVNALVFPAVQGEILNVQDEAGLTRDGTSTTQLLQAVRSGKLTFFVDTDTTGDALTIAPRTSFPALSAGLSLTIQKGPKPNATTAPKLSVGGLVQTIVKEDGSALAPGDLPGNVIFRATSDGTNFRVSGLRKSDAPTPPSQVVYGATSQGGLAKDASNNFLLSLINNLTLDNRNAPAGTDIAAIGRAADGAMVGVHLSALAAYVLAQAGTIGGQSPSEYVAYKVFKTPGTFTFVPDVGCQAIEVIGCWGGGGGGGNGYYGGVGAGGGSGGFVAGAYPVNAGSTYQIVVGAGGTGDSISGGTSSVGSLCSATGGQAATNNSPGTGGAGYDSTGGQYALNGASGTSGSEPGGGNVFVGGGGTGYQNIGNGGSGGGDNNGAAGRGAANGLVIIRQLVV